MNPTDRPGPLQGRHGVTPAGRVPNTIAVELAQVEGQVRIQQTRIDHGLLNDDARCALARVIAHLNERAETLRDLIAWDLELQS